MSDAAAEAALTAEIDAAVAANGGPAAPTPEPAEPEPATDTPEPAEGAEAAADEAMEAAAEEPTEATETDDEKKRPRWEKTRIQQLSREKGDLARALQLEQQKGADLAAAIDALKAGQPADTSNLTAAQINERAQQIAAATLEARDQAARNEVFLKAGKAAFPDFDERCNVVANIADAVSQTKIAELMAIVGEMDDGPKVVAHLADDAEETAKLLARPAHSMALALAKISASLVPPPPKVKPVSSAPKPITPVGGQTMQDFDPLDESLSMEAWAKAMDRRDAQRRKAGGRL